MSHIADAEQLAALEASGVGTLAWDGSRNVMRLSPAAMQLLDAPEDGLGFEQLLATVHPEDRAGLDAAITSALAAAGQFEIRFRPAAASRAAWVALKGRSSRQGEFSTIVATLIDVTGVVAAEEELLEQRRLAALRIAIATTLTRNDSLATILQNCTSHLVDHLKVAFARIWTLNETEQVLELQASSGMYTHLNGPHSRVPVGMFKIGYIAESRQPHLTNSVTTDPRVGDREWAQREKLVAFAGYPLIAAGRLVGVVAMFARRELAPEVLAELSPLADWIAQTIERIRVESELRIAVENTRENEARKTAILESALDCVIGMDQHSRILEFNPAAQATFGYRREDILGQELPELIIPQRFREAHRRGMAHFLQTGEGPVIGRRIEVVGMRADGSEFPVELAVTQNRFDGVVFFTATLRDITRRLADAAELKAAKENAEAASRAKSAFLASMSHELRTPLNAIIGYSEILEEEAADLRSTQFIPDLTKIRSAGKHLLSLINDVLDLSKIEADKMEMFPEEFDIAAAVREVVTTARALVEKNGNRFDVQVPSDIGMMFADVVKVRQCLLNLLSNAGKFTENGSVHLQVSSQGTGDSSMIVFEFEDTGIGISSEELQRLFQPFQQADGATTRRYGGTGLGLTLTRRFAQLMGGDIAVQSTLGSGSKFTLRIPRRSAPLEVAAVPGVADPSDASTSRGKVLIIDDDPMARDLLKRVLSKEGFSPEIAASGESGLRRAKEMHPVAITLDVMMPGLDGWAVLSALKSDPATTAIPVIMVSIIDNRNLGYSLGASDYLTKPVDREQLAAVLGKYTPRLEACSVLVVDDDPETRHLLRHMLEREKCQVREAANGREALDQLAEAIPGLILLDLMMPVMDGFEFALELRRNPAWIAIPVVVLTAQDLTLADRERLNGKIERIVQKGSFNTNDLIDQLRRVLRA